MLTKEQTVGLKACTQCMHVRCSLCHAQSVCDMAPRDKQDYTAALDASPARLPQHVRDRNAWLFAKIALRERAVERLAASHARAYSATGVE